MSKLKISDKFFLYGFLDKKTKKHNLGKKVSKKSNYISSITDPQWWKQFGKNQMIQYCIVESDNADVISAAEYWALDYGMRVLGKDQFYNKVNNAHKGDQSLVTPEIKQAIVDYYEGKLPAIEKQEVTALHMNIVHKVENNEYEITMVPVLDVDSYDKSQVRAVQRNIDGEDSIIRAYMEDPGRVQESVGPVMVSLAKDGTKKIINGNTRLGAAKRCLDKGWTDIPVVFINEEEFGSTEKERSANYILVGSYANREDWIYRQTNTDDDILMQMNNFLALEGINISLDTTRESAKKILMEQFAGTISSNTKLAGLVKKLFNKFDKNQAEITIQDNLKTYSDSELTKYKVKKYENKGISAIVSTFTNMDHFEALGFIFNHTLQTPSATQMAIILHYRTKHEWQKEQTEQRADKLKKTIKRFNLPIIVDVMPAFEK